MKQSAFYDMFLDLLKDLFDAENQIIQNLPKVIQASHHSELKEALSQHLDETKNQVQRLKKIFKTLNENPTGKTCKAMQGLFAEGEEIIKKTQPTAVKDACLIIACQKVEHYEIAGYGSARSIARHLNDAGIDDRIDFDEIADLLQQSLDEESAADEKLTDIAEGGFFTQGINEEAEKEEMKGMSSKRKPSSTR
jgi:ferritin-like metal-binding protein YciE